MLITWELCIVLVFFYIKYIIITIIPVDTVDNFFGIYNKRIYLEKLLTVKNVDNYAFI